MLSTVVQLHVAYLSSGALEYFLVFKLSTFFFNASNNNSVSSAYFFSLMIDRKLMDRSGWRGKGEWWSRGKGWVVRGVGVVG